MWSILGGDKVFFGKSVESFLHNLADEPTNQQSNAHARKHECITCPYKYTERRDHGRKETARLSICSTRSCSGHASITDLFTIISCNRFSGNPFGYIKRILYWSVHTVTACRTNNNITVWAGRLVFLIKCWYLRSPKYSNRHVHYHYICTMSSQSTFPITWLSVLFPIP